MGISIYGGDLLSAVIAKTQTMPSTLYIGVTNETPNEYSTGSNLDEPTDSAYERQAISMSSSFWDDSYSGVVMSKTDIIFPISEAYWGTINYWVMCTAATAGEVIMWTRFDNPAEIWPDQLLSISAGSLAISVGQRTVEVQP